MALLILYILLGITSMAVVGETIYLLMVLFKERKESPDSPMLINFMSHRSNGRAVGVEKDSKKVANRHVIQFAPRDVDMLKLNTKKVDDEKIIVDDYMQVSLPKGLLSKDKNIKFLLPANPEELTHSLKSHPFGAMLMNYIKLQSLTGTEAAVLREVVDRQKAIMLRHAGGELSETHIEWLDSLMSDMIKMTTKPKEQNKFELNRPQ